MSSTGTSIQRVAPFVGAALGLAILALAAYVFVGSSGFGYDFSAYVRAAGRLAAGQALYVPGTVEAYAAGRYEDLYLYSPPPAIALLPLTGLNLHDATVIWLVARIILLVGACLILPVRRSVRLSLVGIAALSFPVLYDLNLGNVSIVLFALAAVAWRWLDTPVSTIAMAAAIVVRPPMALVGLWWLARGRFQQVIWLAVTCAVLFLLSLPFVGLQAWLDFATILRGLGGITGGEHNLSLADSVRALEIGDAVASLLRPAGYLIAAGLTVYAARRRDRDVGFVTTMMAVSLFAPFLHPHYLVALLLPAALLADRGWTWGLVLPLLLWIPLTGLVSGDLLPLLALASCILPLALPAPTGGDQIATSSLGRTVRTAPS